MTAFLDISAALDGHLNTMTSKPPIAWDNTEYTPVVGTLYARPTNIPGDTLQSSLGDNGQDMTDGIYQIDVFSELGKGKNEAIVMADLIANRFKRGTDIVYNARTVTIRSVSRQAANTSGGWYQIPVIIVYRVFTEARA